MVQETKRKNLSAGHVIAGAGILCVFLLIAKVGCDRARVTRTPNSGLNMVEMRIGSESFNLEIANTEDARARGLMRRDTMPADHGMIFVFPDEAERSFWMQNTRIPLDIIYVSAAGTVVSVKAMQPYSTRNVPSDGPAKYAIELNAGAAAEAGVSAGDKLVIPADARDTTD